MSWLDDLYGGLLAFNKRAGALASNTYDARALPGLLATQIREFDKKSRSAMDASRSAMPEVRQQGEREMYDQTMALADMVNGMGTFAGVGAKTADILKLNKAKALAAKGVDPVQVWKQTGWTDQFPDGKWRFEISDDKASLIGDWSTGRLPASTNTQSSRIKKSVGDSIKHDELARAYPGSPSLTFTGEMEHGTDPGGFILSPYGQYGNTGIMAKGVGKTKAEARSNTMGTSVHELTHYVQGEEGFARGGSPAPGVGMNLPDGWRGPEGDAALLAKQIKQWEGKYTKALDERLKEATPETIARARELAKTKTVEELRAMSGNADYEYYRRLAGEAESRLTQSRMNLTPAERAAHPPWLEFDVPREQQIVRGLLGEDTGPAMSINAKQAKAIIDYTKKHGGATFNQQADAFEKSGYAVAQIPPASKIGNKAVPQEAFDLATLTPKELKDYVNRRPGLFDAPNAGVGTWLDESGKLIVDPVETTGSKFRGKLEGNRRQQKAIYDLRHHEEIKGDPYITPEWTGGELPSYSTRIPISADRAKWTPGRPTVSNPLWVSRRGVYDDPRAIVRDSADMVGPEDPALFSLFNVHRPDFDANAMMLQDASIKNPLIYKPIRPPAHVDQVTTKRNAQRLQDTIGLALEDERFTGMPGWYWTQPLFQKFLQYMPPDEAARRFRSFHLYTSPMSAANTVDKEIAKGTFAELLDAEGKGMDFFNKSMLPAGMGHLAHETAHGAGLLNLMESQGKRFWKATDSSPKTPNYFFSKVGENWRYPTPDAHFVRGVGLPDVRPTMIQNKKTGLWSPDDTSIGKTEAYPIGEWFNTAVAEPLGLTGNTGQPTLWGAMASRTGVDSAIGAPLLEIVATNTAKAARRQGVSLEEAFRRYAMLEGRNAYLGKIDPELLGLLGIGSAGAAGAAYGLRDR